MRHRLLIGVVVGGLAIGGGLWRWWTRTAPPAAPPVGGRDLTLPRNSTPPDELTAFLHRRATLQMQRKRLAPIIATYEAGLADNPNALGLKQKLGLVYVAVERLAEAEPLLLAVSQSNTATAETWIGLARIALHRGDTARARRDLRQALALDASSPAAQELLRRLEALR